MSMSLFLLIIFELLNIIRTAEASFYSNNQTTRQLSEYVIEDIVGHGLSHKLKITIGDQNVYAKISTSFCGYWLLTNDHSKSYYPSQSKTLRETSINDQLEFVSGKLAYETINIDGFNISNFPFLYADTVHQKNFDFNYHACLGFGYFCNDENSNIDILKFMSDQNKQLSLVVSFLLNIDFTGTINVGRYPPGFTDEPKYYSSVKVATENKNQQWSFRFHSIYFEGNEMRKIDDYMAIGAGGHIFSVKKDFFEYIAEKYFSKHFESQACYWNRAEVYEIICDLNAVLPKIGIISIIVGKWNFKINGDQLFNTVSIQGVENQHFAMVYYPDHNQYYLSQCYLLNVYIIYDKNKSEVGLWYLNRLLNKSILHIY